MGSIPSPIVSFRWQVGDINAAIDQSANEIRSRLNFASKRTANAFVSEWQRAAAQLRASIATESIGVKQIAEARKNIISLAQQEIALKRESANLDRQGLSSLKAATIEIERQKNALAGRAAISAPTQAILDALKLRVGSIGHMGGMLALRAYEPVGKMFESGVGKMEDRFGGAAVAVGGLTVGLAALGVAAVEVTKHMMDTAQSIQNMAASTGLSIQQVQEYSELSKAMGIDANSLEMAFARMQSQLGEFALKGKAAGSGSQYFVQVLSQMGVQLKTTSGEMRPINDIVADFAEKLKDVGDVNTQTALAMAAFGTRGRLVVQMMQQASAKGKTLKQIMDEIGNSTMILSDTQVTQLTLAKAKWDELGRGVKGVFVQLGDLVAFATIHPLTMLGALATGGGAGLGIAMNLPKATAPASMWDVLNSLSARGNAQYIAGQNQRSLLSGQMLHAGGKDQYALMEAEKNYSEAVKNNQGALVQLYAQQIVQLQKLVALDEQRAKIYGPGLRVLRGGGLNTSRLIGGPGTYPNFSSFAGARSGLAPLGYYQGANPFAIPNIAMPGMPPEMLGGSMTGITGASGADVFSNSAFQNLSARFASMETHGVSDVIAQYQKEGFAFEAMAKQQLITAQQLSDAKVMLEKLAANQISKIQEQSLEKYKSAAGSIFDDILNPARTKEEKSCRRLRTSRLRPSSKRSRT